jgi:hypothetical protein
MKKALIVLLVALMMTLLALLIVLAATPTLEAQTTNNPILQRLGENDLPVIHTQKGFSTLIEFPADHKIAEVTIGDKEFWVVEGSGRFLHVKPAKEGIVTNLNVLMEGDTVYAFILREVNRTGPAKESADLQVNINPGEDPAKLRGRLEASVQENALLKESLAQSQQSLAELNQKYQVEKEKNQRREQSVDREIDALRSLSTSAPVSPPGSAPASTVIFERCSPSNECRSPAAQPIRGPWSPPQVSAEVKSKAEGIGVRLGKTISILDPRSRR